MDQKTGKSIGTTIDQAEVARFDISNDVWRDPHGDSRWLHKYNPVRVDYIRAAAGRRWDRDPSSPDCLRGLRILDIGCGGGVLCEPLAALGCEMVGADPAAIAIEAARLHAQESNTQIDYRSTTAEDLAEAGETFDLVLAMEVIEHVGDLDLFLESAATLVKPGGLMVLSTINRTIKSYAYAIVMAEHILSLLPKGSHQWERFRTPDEIRRGLAPGGLRVIDVSGVTMRLLTGELRLSADTHVNYMMTAERAV